MSSHETRVVFYLSNRLFVVNVRCVVSSLIQVHLFFLFYFSQLVFEARAVKLCPCAKIKVKNVRYLNCHADYFPHSPTGNS